MRPGGPVIAFGISCLIWTGLALRGAFAPK